MSISIYNMVESTTVYVSIYSLLLSFKQNLSRLFRICSCCIVAKTDAQGTVKTVHVLIKCHSFKTTDKFQVVST